MIRTASKADIPAIVDLSRAFYQIAGYPWGFDADHLADMLLAIVFDNPVGVGFVIEVDGKVHGFIVGSLNPIFCSPGTIATEMAWWVDAEYQGSRQAIALIKRFEKWGADQGAKYVAVGSIADLPGVDGLHRLYAAMRYVPKESGFLKELA